MERKLLFVASTHGHVSHFHLPYLRALREDGWIIHTAWGGSEAGLPCVHETLTLPFEKKMYSLKNFRASLMLRKKIRAERYDAVIVHTSLASFFTRLAVLGMRHRPKIINMVHGYLFDDRTHPLKRAVLLAAELITAPVTDLVLTMNRWDYETALRHRLGRAVGSVPGIGVDFSRLDDHRGTSRELRTALGIAAGTFVLIYPAEFSPRKSQHILLRAMTRLPEHVVLILPGTGALLEETRALAERLGISNRVLFPGYITEMGPWYDMADAAVTASRSEGLPFNVMEAMYCGLPVIASSVKGHTDLIRNGENGLLFPWGDPTACAAQIRLLLDDPHRARQLAARAREDCLPYGLDTVLPKVMEAYGSILGTPALK